MTDETSQITVDVEALKREICETVTHNIQKVGAIYAANVVSDIVDHLASAGYLRAPLPRIEGLRAALNNVCEPQKDVVVHCPECQKYIETHNGEWFLWCGDKAHADALIEAARAYLEASEVEMGIRE